MKNKQLQVWDVTFFTDSKKRHLGNDEKRFPAKTVYLSLLKKGEKK